jgi:hypothetical protein
MFQHSDIKEVKKIATLGASKQETLACGSLYIDKHFPKVILVG